MNNGLEILLVDDDAFVRKALTRLLTLAYPGASLTEAQSLDEALALVSTRSWSVVLLDLVLGKNSGLTLLYHLNTTQNHPPVLVLSSRKEHDAALPALRAGAKGFISKDEAISADRLKEAIDMVLNGRSHISDSLAERLVEDFHGKGASYGKALSPQESQVLHLIGSGKPIKEIAHFMKISEKTVRTYRRRISQKLNLATTTELIRYALERGIAT